MPYAELPARFVEHPTADFDNQSAIFRDGHELRRRDESLIRVLPAYQRLDACDLTSEEIHFGLIMQQKLISLERVAQAGFEGLPLYSPGVHFGFGKLKIVAPDLLGMIHRQVSILD